VGALQEWKPATGVPGVRAEGQQPGRSKERNRDPAAAMLETATGRLATTEVNFGLRPRPTLTALAWPALIEHVEWPNEEVSPGYALGIHRAEPH
jgi:hypothetical protein